MTTLEQLRRRWVGCDRCRTRADHRAVVALNRRLLSALGLERRP